MKYNIKNMLKVNMFAATIAALALVGCDNKTAPNGGISKAPAPVKVINPISKKIDIWDEYTARIEALAFVEIRSRVGGYLEKICFTDGQEVKEGELLFVIDPRPYQAALDSAKAASHEIEARLALAKSNYNRAKELYAANAISKETLDTRNSELLSAQAALLNSKAKLRDAELNLEFTQIKSPLSGKVSTRLVDVGNLINANSTLLTTVIKSDVVQVYFEVSERDSMRYRKNGLFEKIDVMNKKGPVVELQMLGDNSKHEHNGVLTYFDNRIGSQTSSLTMRADFKNDDYTLSPGMFAKARVLVQENIEVIMLPEDIIGTDLVNRYVMVVDEENKVQYRPIKPGKLIGKYRIIEDGIKVTDKVVSVGLQRAIPGRTVAPELIKSE